MTDQRLLDMLRDNLGALESKQRFTGLLKDCFPQEPALVNVMALLHDLGTHTEIAKADRVTMDLAYRLTKRLVDGYGIDSGRAESVVALFCTCYAEVIGKPCDLGGTSGGAAPVAQPPAPTPAQTPAPTPRQAKPPAQRSGKKMAKTSLVLGIVSFFVCPVVCAIIGLWVGGRAKKQLAAEGESTDAAKSGIVVNWVAFAWGMLLVTAAIIGVALEERSTFYQTDRGQSILVERAINESKRKTLEAAKTAIETDRGQSILIERAINESERKALEAAKAAIERAFDTDKFLAEYKEQVSIDFTEEGMRIQIKEKDKDSTLFDSGSDRLKPDTIKVLHQISKELGTLTNHIVVGGHTDSAQWQYRREEGYSNWDLSSARANSALRAMMMKDGDGVKPGQVKRVTGYAETVPLEGHSPSDPQNRRISIVVLSSVYEAKEAAIGKSLGTKAK